VSTSCPCPHPPARRQKYFTIVRLVENHFLHYIEISKIAMCMTQDKIENKILCTKLAMCMAQDKIENKILGTKIAICMTQDEI
jgi:hypothetical protein